MINPSNKPKHVPNNSQEQLRNLFTQHNFADQLLICERVEIVPKRKRKAEDTFHSEMAEYEEGIKFRDLVSKQTIAVIFWYTDILGRVFRTIRSLRIGDIVYDAKPHRD
jgi:hypothetical protein